MRCASLKVMGSNERMGEMMQWGDETPESEAKNREKHKKNREKHNWWVLPVACIACVLLVWALDWLL